MTFKRLFFLLSILSLFTLQSAFSKNSEATFPVDSLPNITSILVKGNKRTKAYIILREIKAKPGDKIDREIIEADQKRILNLGLFNRVEIEGIVEQDGIQLIITVEESWYIYPLPLLFLNDRDWSKLSYGAGILHANFRGRREVISAAGWAGYNPALRFDYSNPWILGNTHLFSRVRFFTSHVRNRLFNESDLEVNEIRLGGQFTIGKRFGYFTFASLQLGYSKLEINSAEPLDPEVLTTLNPSGRDDLPRLGLSLLYDARDLHEYPLSGIYARIWARRTGFRQKNIHYTRFGVDLRRYQKVTSWLSIAMRAMTNQSRDKIPIYDLVYLGFGERVRGHFVTVHSGENVAVGSVELRIPILPIKYIPVEDIPIIGRDLGTAFSRFIRTVKYGLSAGLFVDYGNVWCQQGHNNSTCRDLSRKFNFNEGIIGFGAGLHIHFPILKLIRFEWAFNEDIETQIIVDYGVSF